MFPNHLLNKPAVKRPTLDASLPTPEKRKNVIRGGSRQRCPFCKAMLFMNGNKCSVCGSTIPNYHLIKDAPIWKKIYKNLGLKDYDSGYDGEYL